MAISTAYKSLTMEDIIKFCKANKEAAAWLKAYAATPVPRKVYPIIEVEKNGKKVMKADKSQEPNIVKDEPTFVEIKLAFVQKYMPDIAPTKAPGKKTMKDWLAEL